MDVFIHYGMAAGIQAFEDSGLEVTEANAERIGVAIGAGIGGISTIEKTADLFEKKVQNVSLLSLYPLQLLIWSLEICPLNMA